MHGRDFENGGPVIFAQGEIISDGENHHNTDGLRKEPGAFRQNAANANFHQPGADAGEIQSQSDSTDDQKGRGDHFFEDCQYRGTFTCLGG